MLDLHLRLILIASIIIIISFRAMLLHSREKINLWEAVLKEINLKHIQNKQVLNKYLLLTSNQSWAHPDLKL